MHRKALACPKHHLDCAIHAGSRKLVVSWAQADSLNSLLVNCHRLQHTASQFELPKLGFMLVAEPPRGSMNSERLQHTGR